jgi:2'-5' RNA ligase
MQRILKLIAVMPPEPVFSDIIRKQQFIADSWGPKHALRTPPHITLVPPILLSSAEAGWLYGMAEALSAMYSPFTLTLKDYGSFKPRVVFVNLVYSPELKDLQETWQEAVRSRMPAVLDKYPERPFHPHLTLAHKDVTRGQFEPIWKFYESKHYDANIQINEFCMLQHEEDGWAVERRYKLAVSSEQ